MTDLQIEITNRYTHIQELLEYVKLLEDNKNNYFLRKNHLEKEGRKNYFIENKKTEEWKNKRLIYWVEQINISNDLINVLKSNLILMVYNIIEYVIISLVEIIYIELWNHNYDDLKDTIKVKVTKDFREQINNSSIIDDIFKLNDIKKEINSFWYNLIRKAKKNYNHLGWNIQFDTLKNISKSYCFDLPKQSKNSKHEHLWNFKDNRNKLAHWFNSFIEIWRIYTISQLEKEIFETINYLSSLQSKVEDYVINKDFLN